MIINSLRLRNFRRFRELHLEFPENIVGIIGRNGAGKSTLLEAIAWALHGTRAIRTDKLLLRGRNADDSEPCEVELAFMVGGENYRVVRSLRGAAIEAALYRADHIEFDAVRERGVNQQIEKILGLDFRSFEVSIFAKQKELAALSSLTDEPRRKLVSRLINLEAIDLARQKASTDLLQKRKYLEGARANRMDLDELEKQRSAQLERHDAAQRSLVEFEEAERQAALQLELGRQQLEKEHERRDQFGRLNGESKSLQEQRALLNLQKTNTEKEISAILSQQPEIDSLLPAKAQWQQSKSEKESLEEQRRRLYDRDTKQGQAAKLTEQISNLQSEAGKLQSELAGLATLARREKDLSERLHQAEAEVQKLQQEEKKIIAEMSSIESLGKDLRLKRDNVVKLGRESPCPVCTRPLAEHYVPVVTYFEKELVDLRERFKKLTESKKEVSGRLQAAENNARSLRSAWIELSNEREKTRQLQDRLGSVQKRIADLQTQCVAIQSDMLQLGGIQFDQARYAAVAASIPELEKKMHRLAHLEGRIAALPALQSRLAQTSNAMLDLSAQQEKIELTLRELSFDDQAYQRSRLAYENLSAQLRNAQRQVGDAKAALAGAEAELKNIERNLAAERERAEAICRLEREANMLDSLQEHFKVFRTELSGRLRPMIIARASEIVRLATNGRYSLIDLDESYNIYLYDQNQRYELKRFSGGEQDLLNLCLRVAISQVIAQRSGRPPLQFIVLDEIFGSQDEERKLLLLRTLQHLTGYFRQIFLITHEDAIKENLPVVYEVQMVGDYSEVRLLS